MYDWIFLSFLVTLQVPQLCPLSINSSPRSQPESPDLVEVICKEGKQIISGPWLRHRSTVNGVLLPNPKSVVAKGSSCCSSCFSIVRKDSRVCVLTEDIDGVISNMTVRTTEGKTKFNVAGFIVGMLPPLFISFYIILKLGNRSRYAEDRAEEQGIREEPFFVSY
ncbi:uncharacterized protein LOC143246089 [Tachypleus tridentatus]|uniref:uncharacterized protein LOC143246089 n=1 Tax=Tachypleus tridentatus TaxID=6853 RepID=UPI003FCFD9E8